MKSVRMTGPIFFLSQAKWLAALLAILLVGASAGTAATQEAQHVPGTTVSLVPLEGFEPATGFAGFARENVQGSVLIAELPADAHGQLSPLFSNLDMAKTAFATRGVIVEELDTISTSDGLDVPLISGVQTANGTTFDKWIALLKGDITVMITVQAKQGEIRPEAVAGLIQSVKLGDEATIEEKVEALPFEVTSAEPFRVVTTIAGSGVLMTAGELDVDPEGTQPMIIVAAQISGPVSPDMLEQTAEALLKQTKGLEAAQVEERGLVDFAGGESILLQGTTRDGDRIKRFMQYMTLAESGQFIRMIALAQDDQFDGIRSAVEAIANSVAFKE